MIYLDTHIVLWLYEGLLDNLSIKAKQYINDNPVIISPMVMLELQYLYEINRISVKAEDIYDELSNTVGLEICSEPFDKISKKALSLHWTRDPFDRIIIANAMLHHNNLVTKDETIHKHYKFAVW